MILTCFSLQQMMTDIMVAALLIAIAAILSVIHHLSNKIAPHMEKYHFRILSFSGGTLIAIIILILLPEVISHSTSPVIYLLILLGFVLFHLSEKFLYQHVKNKSDMIRELKVLHELGFFLDHFVLGFVLVTTIDLESVLGILILVPIFIYTFGSSISLNHLHENARTIANKVVLSSAPLIGAIVALVLAVDIAYQAAVLAFILGMLIYIVSRDIIPREEKGYPAIFLAGGLLVIVVWLVVNFGSY
jgi:hypothetical protein